MIILDILNKINRALAQKKRKAILCLDLVHKFLNIKTVVPCKNSTSCLQPLNAGTMKDFKAHYLSKTDCETYSRIDGSALTTTRPLTTCQAYLTHPIAVRISTLQFNCFKFCGVQPRADKVTDLFAEESKDDQEKEKESQNESFSR